MGTSEDLQELLARATALDEVKADDAVELADEAGFSWADDVEGELDQLEATEAKELPSACPACGGTDFDEFKDGSAACAADDCGVPVLGAAVELDVKADGVDFDDFDELLDPEVKAAVDAAADGLEVKADEPVAGDEAAAAGGLEVKGGGETVLTADEIAAARALRDA